MKTPILIISALVLVLALVVFHSILLSIPAVLAFIGGYWVGKKESAVSAFVERGLSKTKAFFQKLKSTN